MVSVICTIEIITSWWSYQEDNSSVTDTVIFSDDDFFKFTTSPSTVGTSGLAADFRCLARWSDHNRSTLQYSLCQSCIFRLIRHRRIRPDRGKVPWRFFQRTLLHAWVPVVETRVDGWTAGVLWWSPLQKRQKGTLDRNHHSLSGCQRCHRGLCRKLHGRQRFPTSKAVVESQPWSAA